MDMRSTSDVCAVRHLHPMTRAKTQAYTAATHALLSTEDTEEWNADGASAAAVRRRILT